MSVNGYRVRVAGEPKFFEATDGKPDTALVTLVQENFSHDPVTGEFKQEEPSWYDGRFEGRAARELVEHFRKGDPLIVLGTDQEKTNPGLKDKHRNRILYVKTFGPDVMYTHAQITPEARAEQEAKREMRQASSQDQAVQVDNREVAHGLKAPQPGGEFDRFDNLSVERMQQEIQAAAYQGYAR